MTAVDVDALEAILLASQTRKSATADGALIAAATNALPALLAAVRERDALRAAMERLADEFLVPVNFEVTHYRDGLRDAGRRIRALLADVDGGQP